MEFAYYLLFLATAIQLLYFGFFYSRILFIPKSNASAEDALVNNKLPVSVLVCAHNEIVNLKRLIPALLSQQYQEFEVVVVDDRSTDGSFDYFQTLYKNESRFRMIRINETKEGYSSKKFALESAINEATNEILLLTDADCIPNSEFWISTMVSAFGESKEIVLGYSPYEYRSGILNSIIRFDTLNTAIQYFSFAFAGFPYMGVGRNLGYKKSVFKKNNGFGGYKNVVGGDDDLFIKDVATKDNVAICYDKKAWVWSLPKERYYLWFKQKRRHLSVGPKYNWTIKFLLGMQLCSLIVFYFTDAFLFFKDFKYAFAFLMIRGLVFVVIFALIARKLGDNYKWWWLLLPIEVVYIFNYLVITVSFAIYKKIKWS